MLRHLVPFLNVSMDISVCDDDLCTSQMPNVAMSFALLIEVRAEVQGVSLIRRQTHPQKNSPHAFRAASMVKCCVSLPCASLPELTQIAACTRVSCQVRPVLPHGPSLDLHQLKLTNSHAPPWKAWEREEEGPGEMNFGKTVGREKYI